MADEENNNMTMSDDQMATLAEMVTQQMLKQQSSNTPTGENNPPSEDPKPSGNSLTPEQIADAVLSKIESNSASENKKVYETLWKDKFDQAVNNTPGLKEFVESEDDYGDTRLDRLNGIESYEDRIGALGKLTNSFREASAGKPGRKPVINKAAEKRAKEAEDSYAELNKKVDAGDYNNVGDMTNDFFAAIAKEIEGIA